MVRKYFEYLQRFFFKDIINLNLKRNSLTLNVSFENNEICDFQAEVRVTGLSKFTSQKKTLCQV